PIDSAAIGGTREAPWFLSNHIMGGFLIGDDEFFEHLCNLLNALLLAQREEGGAQGDIARVFFAAPAAPDHVRLVGFPRIPIAKLVKEIATVLAKTVLHRAYHGTLEPGLITALERILSEKIKQFLSGGLGADQVLEVIIGRGGFKSWPTVQILGAGKDLLRRQLHRLSVEAPLQTTQSTPPLGFFTRLWRKLLVFFRKAPPVVSGPDKENLDYLRTNLKRMLEIIEVIEEQAKGGGPRHPDIPTDLINSWSSALRDKLLAALENRWQEIDILPRLSMVIERSVAKFFFEALHAWRLDGELLREMAKAIEHGDLLRFSAKLIGDQQVQAEALVTSLMIGDHIKYGGHYIRSAFLKVWPGRSPLFLAVGQPVPLEHIQA
ncbi:MAG: hypothetical protein KKD99_01605, partial [Proteobacteria bacterium]|nr:hypothetical protein [Pseudomonadota bacterium]